MAEYPEIKKRSHVEVSYGRGTVTEHCGNCEHYIVANPPRCEHVKSPIAFGMWCKLWEKR